MRKPSSEVPCWHVYLSSNGFVLITIFGSFETVLAVTAQFVSFGSTQVCPNRVMRCVRRQSMFESSLVSFFVSDVFTNLLKSMRFAYHFGLLNDFLWIFTALVWFGYWHPANEIVVNTKKQGLTYRGAMIWWYSNPNCFESRWSSYNENFKHHIEWPCKLESRKGVKYFSLFKSILT